MDFAGDGALEDSDDVPLGPSFPPPSLEVVAGRRIGRDVHRADEPERAVGLAVPPSRRRMWPAFFPESAGTRAAPQRQAQAASECSCSGLSPTATTRAAAMSGPTPDRAMRSGVVAESNDSIFVPRWCGHGRVSCVTVKWFRHGWFQSTKAEGGIRHAEWQFAG